MKRNYHTLDQQGRVNERKLGEFLARNGQRLLPMVQRVEPARLAVDEVIDVVGRKTIEAILWLSAQQVAGAPPSLHRCLASTNLIESPNGGVRRRTRKVCRWKDKNMAKRWAAAAYLRTERNFRCIMGYKDLWALKAILEGKSEQAANAKGKVA